MKTNGIENVKLGMFVAAGAAFLILTLYMIGRNRNLFDSTISVSAHFHNINGLMPGNNVRFSGIDVGTVKKITMISDTSVEVSMVIDKKVSSFIKINAVASVGTDGLMGNKLININSRPGNFPPIAQGAVISTVKPVETDEMLRTLDETNQTISAITQDLRKITQRINNSNGLWKILSDTGITRDIRQTAVNLKAAGQKTAQAANQIAELVKGVNRGEGLIGQAIKDTTLFRKLKVTLTNVESASASASRTTQELDRIVKDIKAGHGTAGVLLTDTAMAHQMQRTLINLEQGTYRFNENMEALKHNWLTRGYFKDQEKAAKKAKDNSKK